MSGKWAISARLPSIPGFRYEIVEAVGPALDAAGEIEIRNRADHRIGHRRLAQ